MGHIVVSLIEKHLDENHEKVALQSIIGIFETATEALDYVIELLDSSDVANSEYLPCVDELEECLYDSPWLAFEWGDAISLKGILFEKIEEYL